MSWRDAPAYVVAHDLAVELRRRLPGSRVVVEGDEVLLAIGRALSFPATRSQDLERADRHLLAVKLLIRVEEAAGRLDSSAGDAIGARLVELGRMLGGWKRKKPGPPVTMTVEPERSA